MLLLLLLLWSRERDRRGRHSLGGWLLASIEHLLLVDSICNLGGLTKEVKVSADWLLGRGVVATESVFVEDIVSLVELVTKSIVRILKVKSDVCQFVLQSLPGAYLRILVVIRRAGKASERVWSVAKTTVAWLVGVKAEERHGR